MFKTKSGGNEPVTVAALNNEHGFEFLARVIRVLDDKNGASFEPVPAHKIFTYKDLAMFLLSQATIIGTPSDQDLAALVVEAEAFEAEQSESGKPSVR